MDKKKMIGILILGGGAIALLYLSGMLGTGTKKDTSVGSSGGGIGSVITTPTVLFTPAAQESYSYPVSNTYNYNIPAFPEPPAVNFPSLNLVTPQEFFNEPTQTTETKKVMPSAYKRNLQRFQ